MTYTEMEAALEVLHDLNDSGFEINMTLGEAMDKLDELMAEDEEH